jgi:transcriptional regulator with XRE-family HTH domain
MSPDNLAHAVYLDQHQLFYWLRGGLVMRIALKLAILQSRRPQYELAQAIGVSEYKLSRYVHGRAELKPEQEAKLEELLHLHTQSADVCAVAAVEGMAYGR